MSLSRMVLGPAATLLLSFTLAPTAQAQQSDRDLLEAPRHRQGYYISLGYSGGAAHNWLDGDGIGAAPGNKAVDTGGRAA